MMTRRTALARLAGGALAATAAASLLRKAGAEEAVSRPDAGPLKGRINHSVCRWCYEHIPLEALCRAARGIGIASIDLVTVRDIPVLREHGLICAMVTGVPGNIPEGLNRPANHDAIAAYFEDAIPRVAEAGYPNMICFSGNRNGMDAEQGLDNCAAGIRRVAGLAERHGVTLCMEMLNSKVDHRDYMGDHSAWGFELCRRVGSERFKILYDIYHMQIMEGDVIRTIRENHGFIAHYHTGGVPGRHEIDDTQELCYPAIMRAIADTGFRGFVAQEFIPARPDPLESLAEGVRICDV